MEISAFCGNIHIPWILSAFCRNIHVTCIYPYFVYISAFHGYYPHFVDITRILWKYPRYMDIIRIFIYIPISWRLSAFRGNIHIMCILSAFSPFYLPHFTYLVKVTGADI